MRLITLPLPEVPNMKWAANPSCYKTAAGSLNKL